MDDSVEDREIASAQQANRHQFHRATQILVAVIVAVLFICAVGGVVQERGEGVLTKGQFVLATLLAPMGLVLLLSGVRSAQLLSRRIRRNKP